jgi:hypothetical protein
MLDSLASPANVQALVVVALAFLARDVVVAAVRALSKKLLTDKDPKNDDFGKLLALLADNLGKLQPPGPKA